ncbi:fatty acid alpha-hydroxylase [Modicella reniformis]|uniref:Ceramide very long chain fatty acid hydroxylase n=1 Tax=Modicella reniformis TaxID=1440133 RepID=A0A9P6IX19_9FUNG|nr:fatty acid alpha-hydroxylase [Modicella reniformis]
MQTYSVQQVQAHCSADDCWVIHKNKVYNVSSFIADHPGGEDYILDHAGKDITVLMHDQLTHLHSDGAYDMMHDFLIGSIEIPEMTLLRQRSTTTTTTYDNQEKLLEEENLDIDIDIDIDIDYLKPTDLAADKKSKFLDLSQPLLYQLWTSDFSKAFYLEQVHIPRHLPRPAQIFGSPYLEVFTKTPWYVIPIFWLPIIAYNVHMSLEAGQSPDKVATSFLGGIMRLVMPPVLAVVLATPLNKLAHSLFREPVAYAVMAGALLGYVLYDLTHYYLHHAKVFKVHFQEMKTYHLAHHYKNYEGGYGITSKIWDRVFNTELKL